MKSGIAIACLLFALPAMTSLSCDPDRAGLGELSFKLGVEGTFYPWSGTVSIKALDAKKAGATGAGEEWWADFDLRVDLRRLKPFREYIQSVVVALVGEPIFNEDGVPGGFSAVSISSLFTTAGVPLSYYEGTLPVRALGSRRGSPFEAIMEFPPAHGKIRLKGRLRVFLPEDIPDGYYRPHVEIFVKLKGSNTPIDVGHLPYQLNQWLDNNADIAGPPGGWMRLLGGRPDEPYEFMHKPQVLPVIRVGEPAPPRPAWTIFHDVNVYGQSGLLPEEDKETVGLLNRVRFPTPFLLPPGRYLVNPGLPNLFPEVGLADLFIGDDTVPAMIMNYLVFDRGMVQARLTGPDSETVDLGKRRFDGFTEAGPRLENGGYLLELLKTGEYTLEMTGEIFDRFGRRYPGGGTYRFTVAMPLSFSTPVKPGTNFLVGSRYPAAAKINPPVPAQVTIEVAYYPNSDPERVRRTSFSGQANEYGHFASAGTPMVFDEPGEYYSRLTTKYVDPGGNLWFGAQVSAGVIAPARESETEIRLHGGRTYLAPPNPKLPNYGGRERYESGTEGGSSMFEPETLSQYDYIFPYFSGDTLFMATTYPFESVVGIVLSMEAKSRDLARRLVEAYNPEGTPSNFPITPKHRKPIFLPDVFKFSEDSFAYYRISEEHPDHLPILWANQDGLSPFLFRENNEIEAYTYLSVIRPGFSVMALAYAGSFQGPCWIVSPNPYGGQINAGPNGDLPGDIYRIMAGLVVKDKVTGKNYYDAYSAMVVALPPGTWSNSVSAPGKRSIFWQNGRDQKLFIGLDTSDSFTVGEKMLIAGGVMPPVSANLHFVVTKPDGSQEIVEGRSNRLGGFPPPRAIDIDQPGVYRVKGRVERDGATGDIPGTGDGEFFHFAIPADSAPVMEIGLPFFSRVPVEAPVVVPIAWPDELTDVRLTWSIMMPGAVMDEGSRRLTGNHYDFTLRMDEMAIQYSYVDSVDYSNGRNVRVGTTVIVLFFEALKDGEKVYDMVRVILRGERLYNMRAIVRGKAVPGNLIQLLGPPQHHAGKGY